MTNEEFLRQLYGILTAPVAPVDGTYDNIMFVCIALVLSVLFWAIAFGLWRQEADMSAIFLYVLSGFFLVGGLLETYNTIQLHNTYKTDVIKYEQDLVEYNEALPKWEEERERVIEAQKQYPIYFNGIEVDYDNVRFVNYKVIVDDNEQVIYLSDKG